jgi:hypothetical protein
MPRRAFYFLADSGAGLTVLKKEIFDTFVQIAFDRGEKNPLLPNFTPLYDSLMIIVIFGAIKTAHQI